MAFPRIFVVVSFLRKSFFIDSVMSLYSRPVSWFIDTIIIDRCRSFVLSSWNPAILNLVSFSILVLLPIGQLFHNWMNLSSGFYHLVVRPTFYTSQILVSCTVNFDFYFLAMQSLIDLCFFVSWCHVYLWMSLRGGKPLTIFQSNCLQIFINLFPPSLDTS